MMKRLIYGSLLAVVAVAAALDASAQRYPERRTTRQGNQLYYKGDFESAGTAYRRALELQPELREAAFNLGDALLRQEKATEAANAWMGIAADSLADPGLVSAAGYNLGNAMLAGQKIDEAIEFYKQSLRLKPDDKEAKYNLAYARKLKQQQQDEDQNQDQQQDGGGGGGDDQDQNEDKQDGDQGDDGGDGDGQGGEQPSQGDPPPPSEGPGGAGMDPADAEHMLDAMQAEEDNTREKMNAREVQAVSRSGKNW